MKKPFVLFVSGKYPLLKTIFAESLALALASTKDNEIQKDAAWSISPIFEGERRVSTSFKIDGKSHRLSITNENFGKHSCNGDIK